LQILPLLLLDQVENFVLHLQHLLLQHYHKWSHHHKFPNFLHYFLEEDLQEVYFHFRPQEGLDFLQMLHHQNLLVLQLVQHRVRLFHFHHLQMKFLKHLKYFHLLHYLLQPQQRVLQLHHHLLQLDNLVQLQVFQILEN
jgi:hypothetical protein